MKHKAVLFDKDGTVIDFDALWLRVSEVAAPEILREIGADANLLPAVLAAYGVENGTTRIDGPLCWGTYRDMSDAMHKVLLENGFATDSEHLYTTLVDVYHRNLDAGEVLPACPDLANLLRALHAEGRLLFLVTSDSPHGAEKCLDALGIRDLFDGIYASDGTLPSKPNPAILHRICEQYGLAPEETVMVGDSAADINFGKNGGAMTVGLARTDINRALLAREGADVILPDISTLRTVLL